MNYPISSITGADLDALAEGYHPLPTLPHIETAGLDESLDFLGRMRCPYNDMMECCKDYKACDGKCGEHENKNKGER